MEIVHQTVQTFALALTVLTINLLCKQVNSQPSAGTNIFCYDCVTFDGIEDPVCINPVARGARQVFCNRKNQDSTCVKVVWYSIGKLRGQILKSWAMKRQCLSPVSARDLYQTEFKCNECRILPGTYRVRQREVAIEKGYVPQSFVPEEHEQSNRLVCACCTTLCNAEEGFNISKLQKQANFQSGGVSVKGVRHLFFMCAGIGIINVSFA